VTLIGESEIAGQLGEIAVAASHPLERLAGPQSHPVA
jgi:hypothetical protein